MRILLPTDSFPPGCGGGGLSAYHLAAGLASRGHAVEVVKLVPGAGGIRETSFEGLPVTEFGYRRPGIPGLGPVWLNERFRPILRRYIARRLHARPVDLVHAQHILSILAAIPAARAAGVPVVSTIRDFWPVCFWDTSLSGDETCPGCSPGNLRLCTRRRKPALWPASLAFIPYMTRTLGRRRAVLAGSDAVICVSTWVRDAVLARAPEVPAAKVVRVPNFVDCARLQDDDGGKPQGRVIEEAGLAGTPYLLYAGKLARNKGVIPMLRALASSGVRLPLVAAARGELEGAFRKEASRLRLDVRLLGWRANDEVHDLMRGATALLFPSLWPEPLARTLLEATALGTPIVATASGGTLDIVRDGETGLLASGEAPFAAAIARVAADPSLRRRFFENSRRHARERFDRGVVLDRVEAVYAEAAGRAVARRSGEAHGAA
jgi:glycosyltransferase involved in cell wall biosynthesis